MVLRAGCNSGRDVSSQTRANAHGDCSCGVCAGPHGSCIGAAPNGPPTIPPKPNHRGETALGGRMRRHGILSIIGACALPLIATVCGEPATPPAASRAPVVTVAPPQLAITDGRDDGGVAHFFFLEPVDRRPKGQKLGPPDRSLEGNLALEICRWLGDHCAQPLLARYTKTTGVGKERLQLDDDDDYYKVRWYTSKFPSVESGQTYRLTVRAAGIALGSADVMIVKKNRDLKKVDKDDFVGVKDDDGLTIRFYIER